jgi:hypothetical protein
VPNSTVWPGCNSVATKSLRVSSDADRPKTHSQQMRKKTLLRTVGGGTRSA